MTIFVVIEIHNGIDNRYYCSSMDAVSALIDQLYRSRVAASYDDFHVEIMQEPLISVEPENNDKGFIAMQSGKPA